MYNSNDDEILSLVLVFIKFADVPTFVIVPHCYKATKPVPSPALDIIYKNRVFSVIVI